MIIYKYDNYKKTRANRRYILEKKVINRLRTNPILLHRYALDYFYFHIEHREGSIPIDILSTKLAYENRTSNKLRSSHYGYDHNKVYNRSKYKKIHLHEY